MERQSLSDQHKEAVKAWVPKVRRLLEEDLAAQLDRLGLKAKGQPVPLEKMSLPEEARAVRARVEALLQRETMAEGSAGSGYDNVLRELTYTFLNRLVGLKSMEARRLLYLPPPLEPGGAPEETEVIKPIPGQVHSRFLRDLRVAGGSRYKYADDAEEALVRDGLNLAFRHITCEIRVLFDPDHEYVCIWPTHACLVRAIGMINHDLPEEAFRAQDFLGWIYQFFNRDEKKRVRTENKGTPRSSYELAVINQFYTPSWIVKALVDNTLGRLWCQMHPDSILCPKGPPPLPGDRAAGEPRVDYLVPHTGERTPYACLADDGEVRRFKRTREITLLDPACGTLHFGQYAFGLFHRMYLEEIEYAGEPGWPEEPSIQDPRDIPAAIIENNLFGIDIDPRAIQIASLSLLLTAKEAALRQGDDPREVRLRGTNLAIANAVDLGEARLRQLVEQFGARLGAPDLRQRLFQTLWENLQHVGELGNLVQVREGVAQVLDDWVDRQAVARGFKRLVTPKEGPQLKLGAILSDVDRARICQLDLERHLLKKEAERLRRELLEGVEAAAAEVRADPSRRLFAEDTARGLQLLELLSRRYDIVVMNPPYGAFVPQVRDFVQAAYPLTKNNIYAAFIDRATQLMEKEGYVGALVSSTFINLKDFEKLRTEILLKRNPLVVMLDLGFGILDDATVEAAAIVLRGGVQ